ncbi:MAG: transcription antitermination factor NusB [Candidatus Margulisiibacteriota bacterium]
MGKRTTARRLAMQALYQIELSDASPEEAILSVSSQETFPPDTMERAKVLLRGVVSQKAAIDRSIASNLAEWTIERLGAVDRNILRVCVWELEHERTEPGAVVMNEAVELAKKYGGEESKKFINGVLASVAKKLKL